MSRSIGVGHMAVSGSSGGRMTASLRVVESFDIVGVTRHAGRSRIEFN
jgi:hypothetical protein